MFELFLRWLAAAQHLTPDGFDEDWHTWSPDENFLDYGVTPIVNDE